ncbi:hypothetical protein QOZ80_2AG0125480 [Eleusine coracana subsp. coracana]|nr:hypothetical protein QOZ80_2AG0125480 [Eleusine coracana subsp. coracana]
MFRTFRPQRKRLRGGPEKGWTQATRLCLVTPRGQHRSATCTAKLQKKDAQERQIRTSSLEREVSGPVTPVEREATCIRRRRTPKLPDQQRLLQQQTAPVHCVNARRSGATPASQRRPPMAASPSPPVVLRPRGVVTPAAAAAGSAACSCCCSAARSRGLLLRPPSARAPRRRRAPATHPVRFCASIASGWPVVLGGSVRRGFGKGLSAAGDQAGEGAGDDDDVRITNENLRATIRKSKEVLAKHRNLLEQISEKKKLISVITDRSIHNEHGPFSGQSDSSFSEGDHQAYLDMHEPQSEFDETYEELIDDQNETYETFEGEDTDFSGSSSNYLYDSFPRASPSIYEPEAANVSVDILNIILVAAECAPWSKTGGLGDVAGALPKALARRGHRVMVVVPKYGDYAEPQLIGEPRRYQVAGQDMEVNYYHAYVDGVDFVFIDNPIFHNVESEIYGGNRTDILKRMVLLCKAAVEVQWYVPCGGYCYGDGNLVFIANDWHTSLLPVYLKAYYRDNGFMTYARSVLVIHNIAHQGRGPIDDFNYLDLPGHYMDMFKLYDPFGGDHLNIFAAGIKAADRLLTVSHGYAWELKTSDGGWGLHNIINESDWKFQGKAQCKEALQKELGLPVHGDVPVIAFIGRLDHQKGVDLIAEAMPWIASQDVQVIMLGTGRQDLEDTLRRLESQYYDRVRGWVGFSVRLAHRMTAGADVLLMPSRFEPCGLNQLYAMMYGTVPVVHAVGGLRDTVEHYNPYEETGLGWTFEKAEANRMIDALGHCLNTYQNYRSSWEGIQRRGMMQDLSWDNAAKLYEEVLLAAKYQW